MSKLINTPLDTSLIGYAHISKNMEWFWELSDTQKDKLRKEAFKKLTIVGRRTSQQLAFERLEEVNCVDIDCMRCPAAKHCEAYVERFVRGKRQ